LPAKPRASAKAGATGNKEKLVRRWLVAFLVIALIALAAGFLTFGGADMGR
jgi:hypothetical protein